MDIADGVAENLAEMEPFDVVDPDEGENDWDCDLQTDDLITEDYLNFYLVDSPKRGPAVEVEEGEDWEPVVAAWMLENNWFPTVWSRSDHGNCEVIGGESLTKAIEAARKV